MISTPEIEGAFDAVIRSAWERGRDGMAEGASDVSVRQFRRLLTLRVRQLIKERDEDAHYEATTHD